MRALEDWYWWFVARRAAAARFLQDHLASRPVTHQSSSTAAHDPLRGCPGARAGTRTQHFTPCRILDAGCGTGAMLDLLSRRPGTEAIGVDVSFQALAFSWGRGQRRLVNGDLTALPFADESFDAVTALDVIEHVPDDRRALEEILRVLRPGGILVASVPAYRFLWGPHDEALHHQRRYSRSQFSQLLQSTGFELEKETHLVTALFPLAAVLRVATRWRRPAYHGLQAALPRVPRWLNQCLIGLQRAELAFSRRWPLPFGLSVLAVARRPARETIRIRIPLRAVGEARSAVSAVPQGQLRSAQEFTPGTADSGRPMVP